MAEINKENFRLWVDALRSGKYEQGKRVLIQVEKDGSKKYCCLGVACEVAAPFLPEMRVHFWDSEDYEIENRDVVAFDGVWETLPDRVISWLGLEPESVSKKYGNPTDLIVETVPKQREDTSFRSSLSALNDAHYFTFEQIADAIEHTFLS